MVFLWYYKKSIITSQCVEYVRRIHHRYHEDNGIKQALILLAVVDKVDACCRSHHDYGLVNHALCAAMREMLKVRVCSISHYFGLPNLIYACRTTKLSYPILNMHTTPHPPSPCKNSGSMSIQLCILFLSSSSSPSPSLPPPLSTPSESLALSPRKFC